MLAHWGGGGDNAALRNTEFWCLKSIEGVAVIRIVYVAVQMDPCRHFHIFLSTTVLTTVYIVIQMEP